MADSVDLLLLGYVPLAEVRERAAYDLKRCKHLVGDVDVDVRVSVPNRRCLTSATASQPVVEQVITAAVQCQVIESRRSIRSIRYARPVLDGLECTMVSFRPSSDRLLVI